MTRLERYEQFEERLYDEGAHVVWRHVRGEDPNKTTVALWICAGGVFIVICHHKEDGLRGWEVYLPTPNDAEETERRGLQFVRGEAS